MEGVTPYKLSQPPQAQAPPHAHPPAAGVEPAELVPAMNEN